VNHPNTRNKRLPGSQGKLFAFSPELRCTSYLPLLSDVPLLAAQPAGACLCEVARIACTTEKALPSEKYYRQQTKQPSGLMDLTEGHSNISVRQGEEKVVLTIHSMYVYRELLGRDLASNRSAPRLAHNRRSYAWPIPSSVLVFPFLRKITLASGAAARSQTLPLAPLQVKKKKKKKKKKCIPKIRTKTRANHLKQSLHLYSLRNY
jgi:hypothetical protein